MTASVIIPVYNGARYLTACLDSVLGQTLTDFEVICVDDGSTDATPRILEDYRRRDMRLRVISAGHADAGTCRNLGLRAATGEVLFFLDADDVFAPRFLACLIEGLERTQADIAFCAKVDFCGEDAVPVFGDAAEPVWRVRANDPSADLFAGISSCAWNKAFRRDLVERHGLAFLAAPSSNDFTFVIAAISVATRCAATDACLVAHRYHASSIQATRGKSPEFFFAAVKAYRREMGRLDILKDRPWVWERFREYYLEHLYWQFGTLRTAGAYDALRRAAIATEETLRIGEGPCLPTALGRHRLRRYRAMVRGAGYERVWAALERRLAFYTGDYELHRRAKRLCKRLVRWGVTLVFDPLLPFAKLARRFA